MKLQTGDTIPDFKAIASQWKENRVETSDWSLAEHSQQKPILLLFYPGDFTPVCTKQLCDYRDRWSELKALPVQIVGVSSDSIESHARFLKEHRFPFPLLADPKKEIFRLFDMLMFGLNMGHRGYVLIDQHQRLKAREREVLPIFKKSTADLVEWVKSTP